MWPTVSLLSDLVMTVTQSAGSFVTLNFWSVLHLVSQQEIQLLSQDIINSLVLLKNAFLKLKLLWVHVV